MKEVFADSSYWIALIKEDDSFHLKAVRLSEELGDRITITTEFILTEILNYYSNRGAFWRKRAIESIDDIFADPGIKVMHVSQEYFVAGLGLFKKRLDKSYSFTDCVSMIIMKDESISDILSADHHFEQEGFTRLLK